MGSANSQVSAVIRINVPHGFEELEDRSEQVAEGKREAKKAKAAGSGSLANWTKK
jgi:hypothetical protein